MGAAGDRINDARRHVRSARLLASEDPTLAIAACHDAIRKALTAHMTAAGLRPRSGEGAHRIVLEYARHRLADVITAEDLTEAEDIRRDRAIAEYGDFATRQLDADHIRAAADAAEPNRQCHCHFARHIGEARRVGDNRGRQYEPAEHPGRR